MYLAMLYVKDEVVGEEPDFFQEDSRKIILFFFVLYFHPIE